MTSFDRVRLGRQGSAVDECVAGGFLGVNFGVDRDLSADLSGDARVFHARLIPLMIQNRPEYTRIGAGMRCEMLWTACAGINEGDVVMSPNPQGLFHVGRVAGPYRFSADSRYPHQRPVQWQPQLIARTDMSDELRRATAIPSTVVSITPYAAELDGLLGSAAPVTVSEVDPMVEDASAFALEKHLEDFLVANWAATELGQGYRIYEVDGERVGQQFPTDTGPIDILAISSDGSELLVVELKRGRASDVVVGQIQRYMGYVAQDLAEPGQRVPRAIIAFDDDVRIRRALAVAHNIDFYRYQVRFTLAKS